METEQSNFEEQSDELMALDTIINVDESQRFKFHKLSNDSSYFYKGSIDVDVDLKTEINVTCQIGDQRHQLLLRFLPPIRIDFKLPKTYPSQDGPEIQLTCSWLSQSQLKSVKERLLKEWSDNECVILYLWYTLLHESALEIVDITDTIDITKTIATDLTAAPSVEEAPDIQFYQGSVRFWHKKLFWGFIKSSAVQDSNKKGIFFKKEALQDQRVELQNGTRVHFSLAMDPKGRPFANQVVIATTTDTATTSGPQHESDSSTQHQLRRLMKELRECNEAEEERSFQTRVICCEICFDEKLGRYCLRFPGCDHAYCRQCLSEYFRVKIEEGAVNSLTCPREKCESQALPNQVKELISPDLYIRYEGQLLETTLNAMSDVILCPRRHCQTPVMIDRDNSMGNCPNQKCHFVFCIYCKATYHGVQACRIKSKEHAILVREYMTANEASKAVLEKRYGRKQLQAMVDEHLSEKYKEGNTKPCPKCNAPIEKSDGCNKMTCNKCGTNFCYICGAQLSRETPYAHFSIVGGDCFNRLFEGVTDDEFWEDEEDLEDDWNILRI